MSSNYDRWKSPAWMFQSKADAVYDLLGGATFSGSDLDLAGTLDVTGATVLDSTLQVDGAATLNGNVTLLDDIEDTVVLNGRVATGSVAGAALDIDSDYTRGELLELRANVSDYTNIPQMDFDSLGDADIFTVAYLRSEVGVDGSDNGAVGVIGWGVANAVGAERIEGGRFWAYAKGDTTDSLDYAWGVRGEFSMDAGRANTLTLTEAAAIAGRITSGKVDSYAKIHGMVIRFGDMDGGSRTYGDGIKLIDGPESGTSVLTNVIETNLVATNLIKVGASTQGGVTVSADGMTASPESAAEAGYITIDVGGTGYQIPIYAA